MARESQPVKATPTRRASSAGPSTSASRPPVRTPGSQGRGLQRPIQGLSASGRKVAPPTATPHARAAFRTIDSRRAAIFTPHRARRQSLREARDSPRNFLLSLGRVLAKNTEPIATSSSSPDKDKGPGSDAGSDDAPLERPVRDDDDMDDDDEELPKRPRLSLPIDDDNDDDAESDDLLPHQSQVLDDDNFTMQSIEMPRRAVSERPGSRYSMSSVRMSDYFNTHDMLHSADADIDSGFFPPPMGLDDDDFGAQADELASSERLELDDVGRRDAGRESDFAFEVPLDTNESTFVMAPQVQDSPTRLEPELDEPMLDDVLMDPRSDDSDGSGLDDDDGHVNEPFDLPDDEVTNAVDAEDHADTGVVSVAEARSEQKGAKKKGLKVSRYGIEYPSLPPAVVKKLAQTFAKAGGAKGKIIPDALKSIMQASEWFFEQLGDDLQAYANHAGRKTIDESDILTLMRRQRQIGAHTTAFSLAQRHLPRELLQELRMTPPAPSKKRRRPSSAVGVDAEEVT